MERLQFARQFSGESVGELGGEWDSYRLAPATSRRLGYVPTEIEPVKQPLLARIKDWVRRSYHLKKLIYAAALGGHLVPKFISRLPITTVPSEDMLPWGNFCREAVVYRWRATGEGYIVQRDRKRFFKLFFRLMKLCFVIVVKSPRVIKSYRAAYPQLTSAEYWNAQFEKEKV